MTSPNTRQYSLSHQWSILNIGEYHRFAKDAKIWNNHFINTFCTSGNFSNEHLVFYLKLYPIIKRDKKEFISLSLYCVSSIFTRITLHYKLSCYGADDCLITESDEQEWTINGGASHQFSVLEEFIQQDNMLDPQTGLHFALYRNLTIHCQITYQRNTLPTTTVN